MEAMAQTSQPIRLLSLLNSFVIIKKCNGCEDSILPGGVAGRRLAGGGIFEEFVFATSKILYFCASQNRLPDRLMAGLQILVLTMLVRIQLGQQGSRRPQLCGLLYFQQSS